MTLRGISEAAHGSAKISNLGQNRISANRQMADGRWQMADGRWKRLGAQLSKARNGD
jgi:hypothetical protein